MSVLKTYLTPSAIAFLLFKWFTNFIRLTICNHPQVELTADFSKQELLVKQLGDNPFIAASTVLKKGDTHLLGPMAILELLEGQYNYRVHFSEEVHQELLAELESAQEDGEEEIGTKIKQSPIPTDSDMDTPDNPEPPLNESRKRRHSPNGLPTGK